MRESAATQRVATNVQPREASSAPVVTLAPLVNHRLICLHSSGLPQRITNVVKYRNVLSSPRRSGRMLVTETRRSRLAKTVQYKIAYLIRMIDALDNPTMKVLLWLPVAALFLTAARRVHDHIRNSEPALERSGLAPGDGFVARRRTVVKTSCRVLRRFENVVAGFSPRSGSDAERGLQPATTFICPRYFASVALTVYVSDARIRCASVSRS